MAKCPCCSKKSYAKCCKPYHQGRALPPTPVALMRSRYSAYTLAKIDYIEATQRGPAAQNFEPLSAKQWAQLCQWQGLKIISHSPVVDDIGYVEFVASYDYQGQSQQLAERSEFHRIAGRWYYVDGLRNAG